MSLKLSKLHLFLIIIGALVLSTLGFSLVEGMTGDSQVALDNVKKNRAGMPPNQALDEGSSYDPFGTGKKDYSKPSEESYKAGYESGKKEGESIKQRKHDDWTVIPQDVTADDFDCMRSEEDPRLMNCYYGRNVSHKHYSTNHVDDKDLYILKSKIVPPVCPKCPDCTLMFEKDTMNKLGNVDETEHSNNSNGGCCPGCQQKDKITNSHKKPSFQSAYREKYNRKPDLLELTDQHRQKQINNVVEKRNKNTQEVKNGDSTDGSPFSNENINSNPMFSEDNAQQSAVPMPRLASFHNF